jgi:hypothetical protein
MKDISLLGGFGRASSADMGLGRLGGTAGQQLLSDEARRAEASEERAKVDQVAAAAAAAAAAGVEEENHGGSIEKNGVAESRSFPSVSADTWIGERPHPSEGPVHRPTIADDRVVPPAASSTSMGTPASAAAHQSRLAALHGPLEPSPAAAPPSRGIPPLPPASGGDVEVRPPQHMYNVPVGGLGGGYGLRGSGGQSFDTPRRGSEGGRRSFGDGSFRGGEHHHVHEHHGSSKGFERGPYDNPGRVESGGAAGIGGRTDSLAFSRQVWGTQSGAGSQVR